MPLFPDGDVFIGGDECHTTCWADNAEIVAWARANNLSVTSAVESVCGEGSVFGWCKDDRCFLSLRFDNVRGRLSNSESAAIR